MFTKRKIQKEILANLVVLNRSIKEIKNLIERQSESEFEVKTVSEIKAANELEKVVSLLFKFFFKINHILRRNKHGTIKI